MELLLKVGNVYLRRDGGITEPLIETTQSTYPFLDPSTGTMYTKNGQVLVHSNTKYPEDLVTIWVDSARLRGKSVQANNPQPLWK